MSLGVPGLPENWFPFVDEVVGMSHTMLMEEIVSFNLENEVDILMSDRMWDPIQQHGGELRY